MPSNINPTNIDGNYPVAGQDNDSQGFRDNFTNIKTNLQFTKNEIDDLQSKVLLKSALVGGTLANDLNYSTLYRMQAKAQADTFRDLGATTGPVAVSFLDALLQKVTTSGPLVVTLEDFPPTGIAGTDEYDLIAQQKTVTSGSTGGTGPVFSLIRNSGSGNTGPTGPTGPSISYVAGNEPYAASATLITTTVGTSQTRIYEVGPVTATATTKFLIMANVTYSSITDSIQMTVGVATTSGAIHTTSTNIVSNESPLVLPATTTSYFLAASPGSTDLINLHGFSTHTPGAGTFYYTIWMSSSPDATTYTNMTAILTVLKIQN